MKGLNKIWNSFFHTECSQQTKTHTKNHSYEESTPDNYGVLKEGFIKAPYKKSHKLWIDSPEESFQLSYQGGEGIHWPFIPWTAKSLAIIALIFSVRSTLTPITSEIPTTSIKRLSIYPLLSFFKDFIIYSTEIETASERGNTSRGEGEGEAGSWQRSLTWGLIP